MTLYHIYVLVTPKLSGYNKLRQIGITINLNRQSEVEEKKNYLFQTKFSRDINHFLVMKLVVSLSTIISRSVS